MKYPLIDRFLYTIENLSTTNFRIAASVLCIVATTISVLHFGAHPSIEFLVFLSAVAGLDTIQFLGKRLTFNPDAPQKHSEARSTNEDNP